MLWSEPLPDQCPPNDAVSTEGYTVYRIATSSPPSEFDFQSHRARSPEKKFHVSECEAMSLSVYDDLESTENVTKLPAFKKKTNYIIKLSLKESDGLILKTFGANHYSWWRSKDFQLPT